MTLRRSDLPQPLVAPGPWPTPIQLLLLRACLESGAEARAAWEEWSSIVNLDYLDDQSCYLLPMLDNNLRAIGVTGHPWLGRIRGYRRYIWAKNRRLLAQGSQLIGELRPIVGDELLVIKGMAVAYRYYSDLGLRPMGDFDLMVKLEVAPRVLNHLKASCWKTSQWDEQRQRMGLLPKALNFFNCHGRNMERSDGIEIDLHWNLMPDLCGPAVNQTFWDAAVPMRLPDGSQVRTLELSDLLFHSCLHGLLFSYLQSTRWVVDAIILLQNNESIRWQRLIDVAERFRYTLTLGTALEYLTSTFPRQANIPEAVIHSLLECHHSAEEVDEYKERFELSSNGGKYPPGALTYYRRSRAHSEPQNRSWVEEIRSFANFLLRRWDLPNLWLVVVSAPFRAARRIYRKYLRVSRTQASATRELTK
jgi:putative nucleotidyltransferase-like protein